MTPEFQAKLKSFVCNADSHTKAELLLAYSTQEKQTFVEVRAYHLGPLDEGEDCYDDDNDVVRWTPEARLGTFRGVGIAISLDTPRETLIRLLRKSLAMLESCSPEMWKATCEAIGNVCSGDTVASEVEELPF
jgi:hypothetical protein